MVSLDHYASARAMETLIKGRKQRLALASCSPIASGDCKDCSMRCLYSATAGFILRSPPPATATIRPIRQSLSRGGNVMDPDELHALGDAGRAAASEPGNRSSAPAHP